MQHPVVEAILKVREPGVFFNQTLYDFKCNAQLTYVKKFSNVLQKLEQHWLNVTFGTLKFL